MKKHRLFSVFLVLAVISSAAQAPGTPTVVTDTLHYFYNKQYFHTPSPEINGLPYYKSPAATVTNVTHLGSVFLNTDPQLKITGLSARAAFQKNSNSNVVPITLYLCHVDANLKPVWPPVDSVKRLLGAPNSEENHPKGHDVSGLFEGPSGPVSYTMPGNFAVLVRNTSLVTADTLRIYRTAGRIPGSAGSNTQTAFGEGLGLIRWQGNFYSTRNFLMNANQFGTNTDYEFCVAPIVNYSLIADHQAPPEVNSSPVDSVICWEPLTFTNTSTPHWTSRFFNLNEFYKYFYPYVNAPFGGFSADSSISWYFDDEGIPPFRPNIFLRTGWNTATKLYDTSGCFTSCSMRARFRKMTAEGSSINYRANIEFSVCVAYTGGCEYVGLNENLMENRLSVFPNPAAGGVFTIKGLNDLIDLKLYDLSGRLIRTIDGKKEETIIDLSSEPFGVYSLVPLKPSNHTAPLRLVYLPE